MDDRRQVLLALVGDKQTVKALPEDSPLARHLPAARKAVEAFCGGDDSAMTTALRQIPFRSPYRDLRWFLEALAAYPTNRREGLARLEKIPADSPFRCPAQTAEALLSGKQPTGGAAREFVAAFKKATPANDARALFLALMKRARRHPDEAPRLAEVLKAMLVHHPQGLNAYEKLFGPLGRVERQRLMALHEERYGDPLRAYNCWVDVGSSYDQGGERLKAAAVARHLADMARRFGGPADPEVGQNLINARHLDPDDRDNWLELAEYFRLVDDQKQRRQVVDEALKRFPGDPKVLAAAARTAFDRGSYKKAARLYGRLLQLDPIDRDARWMLMQALMAQARKQLRSGRADLARGELETAGELAGDDRSQARILVLRGMVEQVAGHPETAARRLDEARRLLPPPLADWMIVATALVLERPEVEVKPLLKNLRQVMAHAALKPDRVMVLDLLRDAAALAEVNREAADTLLKAGSRYFKKTLTLDWNLEELREIGELLLRLERWQWLRDLARGHRLWSKDEPVLIWFDTEAKCRGVPENLSPHDVRRLFQAADRAAEQGQSWLTQRIDALIQARSPFREVVLGPQLEQIIDEAPEEVLQALFNLFGGRKQ